MAGSAAVLEEASLISRLDRRLLKLEELLALLSGVAEDGYRVRKEDGLVVLQLPQEARAGFEMHGE
jgi:hypothetical protein